MTHTISATFENGVFKPQQDLKLAPGTKVRLTFEPCNEDTATEDDFVDELEKLSQELPIEFVGKLLTRDELHERD